MEDIGIQSFLCSLIKIEQILDALYEFFLRLAKLNKQFFKKWTLCMGNYIFSLNKRFVTMNSEEITHTVRNSILFGFAAAKPYFFETFKQVQIYTFANNI